MEEEEKRVPIEMALIAKGKNAIRSTESGDPEKDEQDIATAMTILRRRAI